MRTYQERYADNANAVYRLPELDQLNAETLGALIEDFYKIQHPRLDVLQKYYLNRNPIKERPAHDTTRSDNRLSHGFARYITTVVQGYMLGNPIRYKHRDENVMEQVEAFNLINSEHAHNSIIGMNLSIYGRAFELVYRDEQAEERLAVMDPKETFMIYDLTVTFNPLAGVHAYEIQIGKEATFYADVYTATERIRYSGKGWNKLTIEGRKPHYFDNVPIIEYWNNDDRTGDFEPVLDLIDAYDVVQSDTTNEIEDFASAYLVLQGQPNTQTEDVEGMKRSRVIVLDQSPDGSTPAAYYLTKQYDVAGQEALKNRLIDDIHKLSFVPDMSDERFNYQASGEAMKYKLFVFDQLRTTKERLFRDGLNDRYRVVAGSWAKKSRPTNVDGLEVMFNPNLPKNTKELVEIATMLEGVISKRTQLELLPIVENADTELDRMEEEEEEARERNNSYPNLPAAGSAGGSAEGNN